MLPKLGVTLRSQFLGVASTKDCPMASASPTTSRNSDGQRPTTILNEGAQSSYGTTDSQYYRDRTPLPTRVSNACQRCRRNKTRVRLLIRTHKQEDSTDYATSAIPSDLARFACERMSSAYLAQPVIPATLESKSIFGCTRVVSPTHCH